ncbi:hypothetical protein D3C84_1227720 [compost metagenome]
MYTVLQVSDPLCSGIKETTGSHSFGQEMRTILCELTSEMDQAMREVLSRYTIGQMAERALCAKVKADALTESEAPRIGS